MNMNILAEVIMEGVNEALYSSRTDTSWFPTYIGRPTVTVRQSSKPDALYIRLKDACTSTSAIFHTNTEAQ